MNYRGRITIRVCFFLNLRAWCFKWCLSPGLTLIYRENYNVSFKLLVFLGIVNAKCFSTENFDPFSPALWASQIEKNKFLCRFRSKMLVIIFIERVRCERDSRVAQRAPSERLFRNHRAQESQGGHELVFACRTVAEKHGRVELEFLG